jgi:hypothetical protein
MLLKKIIKIKCVKAKTIDYNLTMRKNVVLQVANTKETEWLLQAELKAIYAGLIYKVQRYDNGSYKGYFDRKGLKEGVGISTFDEDSEIHSGEYHKGMLHGIGKCIYAEGSSYWGQFKEGFYDGFGKYEWK